MLLFLEKQKNRKDEKKERKEKNEKSDGSKTRFDNTRMRDGVRGF